MGSCLTVSTRVYSLKYEWLHYMASFELTLCYSGCEVMHKAVCIRAEMMYEIIVPHNVMMMSSLYSHC